MANLVESVSLNLDGSAIDGTAARGLDSTSQATTGLMDNLKKLSSDTGASASLGGLSNVVGNLEKKLIALAGAYLGFSAIKGMVTDIMTATKAHEDLTVSIAATMAVANGWSTSLAIANDTLEKLHKTAALTGNSVAVMTDTFTMLKRTFGGLSTDAADVTQRLALLARQSGTTADSLAYTLARMAQTGLMPRMSTAGLALINIDPKILQTMKDAGLGLDYLKAKVDQNAALVTVLESKWSYLGAAFDDAKEHALVLVGEGFEPLKAVLQGMTADLESLEAQQSFQHISTAIRALSADLAGLAASSEAQAPVWLKWLENIVEGTSSGIARMVAGWETYKLVVRGVTQIALDPNTLWDMASGKSEIPLLTSLDAQRAKIRSDVNVTIAKITSMPSALQAAGDRVAADFTRVALAGKELPSKPAGDKTAKDPGASDAIVNATMQMWAKVNSYNDEGLKRQLDAVDNEAEKEIDKWREKLVTDQEFLNMSVAAHADAEAHKFDLLDKSNEKMGESWRKLQEDMAATALMGEAKQQAGFDKSMNDQWDAWMKLTQGRKDQEATMAIVAQALIQQNLDKGTAAKVESDKKFLTEDTDLQAQLVALSDDTYTRESGAYQKTFDDAKLKYWDPDIVMSTEHRQKLTDDSQRVYDRQMELLKMSLVGVQGNLKSIEEFTKGVWDAMGTAFQTGFYDVLTGKFSDLGNVLKTLWDSILQDFSKMLSNMLKQWIYTQLGMGDAASGGASGKPSLLGSLTGIGGQQGNQQYSDATGGIPGLQGGQPLVGGQPQGNVAAGAIGALGAGYTDYQAIVTGLSKNQQPYTIAGQQYTGDFGGNAKIGDFVAAAAVTALVAVAGAAAGTSALIAVGITTATTTGWTVYGLIAAALIIVVGAILSIINGPKEAKVSMATAQMADPNSPIGQAMWQSYAGTMGSLMATNTLGGGSSGDFAKYMNANMAGTQSWQSQLHAGSGDDLTKDAQAFFQTILPRMNIEQAFGQTWTGQYHSDTGANGIAGISGVPTMVSGSYDEAAAIPKMLASIGLLPAAIHGIAKQIDLQEPAAFLTWLNAIVGVVVGWKTVIANLNKSGGEMQADAQALVRNGGADALKIQSGTVVDAAGSMSDALSMLGGTVPGDAQIKQAQDLITLSETYYNNAKAAMKVLTDMMTSVTTTALSFSETIAQVGKDAGWLASDRTNRMGITGSSSQWQNNLAKADNVTDVQAAWDAFMKDANAQLNYLLNIIGTVNAGMDTMNGLAADFDHIQQTAARNPMDFTTINGDWLALQTLITNTGKIQDKNSQEYLSGLGLISQGTQGLYQEELAFLQAVGSAQKGLNTGIGADIWQNNYMIAGNDDKSGRSASQIGMIKDKIQADLSKIATATDPTVVTQYAGEIRGLLGTYTGFFKPGDSGYDAAYAWANSVLGTLQTTGTTALTGMGASAGVIAAALGTGGESMQTAQALFQTALDVANVALGVLNTAVTTFSGDVNTKLSKWATEIGDDMKKAGEALAKSMNDFTTALGGDAPGVTGGGGPGHGPIIPIADFTTATTNAVQPMINFTTAVNKATDALGGKAA